MISQCHKVMLSGGPVQIRRGPFYYNYGLAPLCMSKDMTKDKGRGYIYINLAQVAYGVIIYWVSNPGSCGKP